MLFTMNQPFNSSEKLENNKNESNKAWFFFTVLFLIIDYGRPHDTIKFIGSLRPAFFLTLILTFYVVKNKHRFTQYKLPQINLIWWFIAVLVILIPFAFNKRIAFSTAQAILLYMPFVLSCIGCIDTIERLKKFLLFAVYCMAFQALHGVSHGGVGTGNLFMDENDFSLYMNTWLPFSFALFLSCKKMLHKVFLCATTLLALGSNVIGFSRGGFLGMIAMFLVFWLYKKNKIVTILVIAILGVGVVLFGGDKYTKEMSTSTNAQDNTGKERIESWKSGWKMFQHYPLGVGGNNFAIRFPEFQTPYFSRNMWGRQAHSLWFTLIPETGIGGILIYLLLILSNINVTFGLKTLSKQLDKDDEIFIKNLSVAFLASFAGFFISSSFISCLYYAHFWYLTGILVTANSLVERQIYTKPKNEVLLVA